MILFGPKIYANSLINNPNMTPEFGVRSIISIPTISNTKRDGQTDGQTRVSSLLLYRSLTNGKGGLNVENQPHMDTSCLDDYYCHRTS